MDLGDNNINQPKHEKRRMTMTKKMLTLALGGIVVIGVVFGSFGFANAKAFAADNNAVKNNNAVVKSQATAEKAEKDDNEDINLAQANVKISQEEAKTIALSSQKDAKALNIELEDENGTIVYGVGVETAQNKYDIKIDATTGKILKSEVDDENESKNTIDTDDINEEVED